MITGGVLLQVCAIRCDGCHGGNSRRTSVFHRNWDGFPLRRRLYGSYRFVRYGRLVHGLLSAIPLPSPLHLRLGLELVVGVVPRVVVPVVLHEAEVDRHLAHRAGHSPSPPLCGGSPCRRCRRVTNVTNCPRSTWSARSSTGMTIFSAVVRLSSRRYPSRGLAPSTAVPTRTCVAPAATACSRSALIPADTIVAVGWSARRRDDNSTNRSKAACSRPA